jgi:hypothetical protein
MHTIFWLENLKGRDNLEEIYVDGNVILDGSYGNMMGRSRPYSSGSG